MRVEGLLNKLDYLSEKRFEPQMDADWRRLYRISLSAVISVICGFSSHESTAGMRRDAAMITTECTELTEDKKGKFLRELRGLRDFIYVCPAEGFPIRSKTGA